MASAKSAPSGRPAESIEGGSSPSPLLLIFPPVGRSGNPSRDKWAIARRRSGILAWIAIAASTILVVWLGARIPIERRELSPVPDESFSDVDKGGNSEVAFAKVKDGAGMISWVLHGKAAYPYCGALWRLGREDSLLDLTGFDGLVVSWRSAKGLPIRWTLESIGPEASMPGIVHPNRLVQCETRPSREWETEVVEEGGFRVPLWWFQSNRRMVDSLRYLDRVAQLTFSSGESAPHDAPDTVEIRSLALLQRGSRRLAFLALLLPIGFLAWWLARHRRGEPPTLPVPPRPLDLPPTAAETVVAFLSANYARPELDLALTARETNLSESAVSSGVKEAAGEGFRQHLGRLRLTEAARLVRSTKLQMTEIAFKVGYGNVSHFNRQFRELWGCSPSEMRQGGSDAPRLPESDRSC